MNIAFRADISPTIGTGHFARCLTLAKTIKEKSGRVFFICRKPNSYVVNVLIEHGFELIELNEKSRSSILLDLPHSSWLDVNQYDDAEETIRKISHISLDWLVVDHYALDYRWHEKLRSRVSKLMVIDDLADRKHDADILLDQNYYKNLSERYVNKVPAHCELLLGPRYALLRDEFKDLSFASKPKRNALKKILIFFGGVDKDNYTGSFLSFLCEKDISEFSFDVVVGLNHPKLAEVKTLCEHLNANLHIQTTNMANLMASADLAVGASGASNWERCCVGLPSVILSVAKNQYEIAIGAHLLGVAVFCESASLNSLSPIWNNVIQLKKNPQALVQMSIKGLKLVDGMGASRVVNVMRELI